MSLFNLSLKPVESRVHLDRQIERGGTKLNRIVRGERVVLSRGLCHFECAPLPPGRRSANAAKAATLAASTRTPFSDAEFKLVWSGNAIGVWSWPRSIIDEFDHDDVTIIPETLLHEAADGPVLRECLEGYEGQVWTQGNLVASRWWPKEPSPDQWARFARSASPADPTGAVESEPAAPGRPDLLNQVLDSVKNLRPRDLIALGIVAVIAPGLFLGGRLANLELSIHQRQGELAAVQDASAEVLAARRTAMAAAGELAAFRRLASRHHPAQSLSIFAETAAGFGAELQSFNVSNDHLEIVLRAEPGLPLAELVEGLESNPVLSGVLLEPANRPNEWRIYAEIEEGAPS